MKAKHLIEHIMKDYEPDEEVAYALWSEEDVALKFEEMQDDLVVSKSIKLNLEDRYNILSSMDHHHDAEYGLSWIVLEEEIRQYIDGIDWEEREADDGNN